MRLIQAYGEYWSRDAIDWGSPGRGGQGTLLGHMGSKRKPYPVDAWQQEAVYVLHADYEVVYVGVAAGTKLGLRLRGHRDDHLAGRWDQFSWYGALAFDLPQEPEEGGEPIAPTPRATTTQIPLVDALREIEALMIRAAPNALNKRNEGLGNADEQLVRQVPWVPDTLSSIAQALADQSERLTAIEAKLNA